MNSITEAEDVIHDDDDDEDDDDDDGDIEEALIQQKPTPSPKLQKGTWRSIDEFIPGVFSRGAAVGELLVPANSPFRFHFLFFGILSAFSLIAMLVLSSGLLQLDDESEEAFDKDGAAMVPRSGQP